MGEQRVEVRVTANAEGIKAGMSASAAAVQQAGQSMRDSMARVQDAFASARTLIAGAMVTVAGAIAVAVKSQVNFQDEMSKGAQRAGVSTETFSELAYVAKLADVEVSELARTFSKLSTTLENAKAGQKEAAELLARLKIDPSKLKDGDQLLQELAERFSQMADGSLKTATAVEVFGDRIGPKLIPFLNAGKRGLEEQREEARRLGVTVSTDAGKAAEELNDNLTRMGAAATGVANEVAKELVPGLVQASQYFLQATRDAGLFQGVLISIGALMAKALGVDEAGKLESKLSSLKAEAERLKLVMVGVDNVLAREPGNEMAQRRAKTLALGLAQVNAEALRVSAELARLASGQKDAGGGRGSVNPEAVKGEGLRTRPEEGKAG